MATTQDPLAPAGNTKTESTVDSVKDRLSDAASHLKDTASQYGSSAADSIDRNVRNAAGTLHNTADTLRSQAGTGDSKVSGLAQSAAGKLDSTAEYLRDFDTRAVLSHLEDWTRQNPGIAIASAAAIGFLIGLSLRRDNTY